MAQLRTHVFALFIVAANLAACHRNQPPKPAGEGHQRASAFSRSPSPEVPGSQLWRIEVQNDGKVGSRQDLCVDAALRSAFSRPAPQLNGQACVRVGQVVEKDGTYAMRCDIDSQQYRVGSVTQGDVTRDLTVEISVASQGRTGPSFEQVRRYRRLGPGPAGWVIADAAAPGATRVTTAVTGATPVSQTPAP